MKDSKIIFTTRKNDDTTTKYIDRKAMYDVFEGIVKGFEGDNEISRKLLKIIPEVDEIYINKDLNSTQDIPFVVVDTDGKTEVIKIIRYHKIVWSILDKYSDSEE